MVEIQLCPNCNSTHVENNSELFMCHECRFTLVKTKPEMVTCAICGAVLEQDEIEDHQGPDPICRCRLCLKS